MGGQKTGSEQPFLHLSFCPNLFLPMTGFVLWATTLP